MYATVGCADLVQTLWEVGLQMFRARITTLTDGQVSDTFWVCDECRLLPDAARFVHFVWLSMHGISLRRAECLRMQLSFMHVRLPLSPLLIAHVIIQVHTVYSWC